MTISSPTSRTISNNLNSNLDALSDKVHGPDPSADNGQIVLKLKEIVINEIDKESTGLSQVSKKYIEDIKLVIQAEDWNKLPASKQLNSDIALFNKLSEDVSFVSKFVGIDINDVLSLLLEFERRNNSIQSKIRQDSQQAMFNSANAEFTEKQKANAAELSAGIVSAVGGLVASLGSVVGGGVGFGYAKNSVKSSHNNLKLSDKLSSESNRLKELKIKSNEITKNIESLYKESTTHSNDPIKLKKIQDDGIRLTNEKEEVDLDINDAEWNIDKLSTKVKSNSEIIASENQIAVNASTLIGGVGKVLESAFQIGAAYLRNDQKTAEMDAEKNALSKNIANDSKEAANDSYHQARDNMHSIVENLRSMLQALDTSFSNQISKV